ncbi:MAG: Fic family protein [Candidatus Diapherotrites archaeon]|uniref:Fic family protein n=1 Tax=Candidatus Iainarchaeum sp. TaxID=3101447 RepID=A0A8T4L678_9ARCH|nr:Fic family protein [Candidatus Diapherotrites archaeon]
MSYLAKFKRGKKTYYYLAENIRLTPHKRKQIRQYIGDQYPSENRLRGLMVEFEKQVEQEKTKLHGHHYLTQIEIEEVDSINNQFWERYNAQNKSVQEQFDQNFIAVFVFNTNSIEGSTLTPKEVELLLEENISPNRPLDDVLEAKGAQKTIEYIKNHNGELAEELIKQLHQRYFQETKPYIAGQYKTRQNRIKGSEFDVTPPHEVPEQMKQLIQEYHRLKKELHPLELAAWVHWKFVSIHPFQDGNGRIARLLMNLVLHKNHYGMIDIKTKEKQAYFKALEKSNYVQNGAPLATRLVRRFKKEYQNALKD